MKIEYDTRTAKEHTQGGKEHGWLDDDHEKAMLYEAGQSGWIMCGVKRSERGGWPTFYFYREIDA